MALEVMHKAAADGFRFPLVISDFQMPDMNGLGFVEAIRQSSEIEDTPVMILSSVDLSFQKETFAELGCDGNL